MRAVGGVRTSWNWWVAFLVAWTSCAHGKGQWFSLTCIDHSYDMCTAHLVRHIATVRGFTSLMFDHQLLLKSMINTCL